jgi:hypothetical protein
MIRCSPWNPATRIAPASIRAWYDDTAPHGFGNWNDRRGAGPDLGLGAGALTSGICKGRVTAVLDGGDWLTATFANVQPLTLLIAVKCGVWTGATVNLADGTGGDPNLVRRVAANQIQINAGADLTATFGSSLSNRWVVIAVVFAGASSRIYEDGVLRASGNAGFDDSTGFTLGASQAGALPLIGELGECLVLNVAQNATVIGEASRYMARKWDGEAVPFAAELAAYYHVDAAATGCTVVTATVTRDLTAWTADHVTLTDEGLYLYTLTDSADLAPRTHSITSPAPANGIRGAVTVELEVTGWNGLVDSLRFDYSEATYWSLDLLTGALTATGTVLWSRVEPRIGGGWTVRLTYVCGGTPAPRIVLQHGGADYHGAGTGSATVRLPLTNGIRQVYASVIPNRLSALYPMTPPSAGYSPKLYDPRTDTWHGETGYPGGWYGGEFEFAQSVALGAMFTGSDVPITTWGDHRPTGEAATMDTVWALEGTTPWHHLRLEVPPNRYAYARRRDDAAAEGTSATRLVATATNVRRLFGDYFTGNSRQIYWAGALSAAAAQDVGACTWSNLSWGGQGGDWQVQGSQNSLFVARAYYAPGSAEDLAVMAWLNERHGVTLVTLPATPPHAGVLCTLSVSVPAGVAWTLTLGEQAAATGVGTGGTAAVSFYPLLASLANNTAILSLTTALGRDSARIAVDRYV